MNYFEKATSSFIEIFSSINISLTQSHIDFLKSASISKSIAPPRTYEEQMSLVPLRELPLPTIDQILNSHTLEEPFIPFSKSNKLFSGFALRLLKSFFKAAENGYHYIDPLNIENRFGKTISVAYLGASKEFITFAESFWTFKLLVDEIVITHKDLNLTLLYDWLEFNIGSVFFPAGGGHPSINLQRRIDTQRKLMNMTGFQKVEAFISGNPMLKGRQNIESNSSVDLTICSKCSFEISGNSFRCPNCGTII